MKTAEKEIGCVSLYRIRASGLKGTVAYKYLLLSLMLIKQQNGFDKDLDLIYTVNTMQCYFSLITFLYLNTTDLVLFVTLFLSMLVILYLFLFLLAVHLSLIMFKLS